MIGLVKVSRHTVALPETHGVNQTTTSDLAKAKLLPYKIVLRSILTQDSKSVALTRLYSEAVFYYYLKYKIKILNKKDLKNFKY